MKNKKILNILILVTIAILLFAMPTKVFADPGDLTDIFGEEGLEDQGNADDLKTEEGQQPTTQEPEQPAPSTPESSYTQAGLVEDTIMIIAIAVLGITAVYAYRKVNEYQSI